jgi:ATP-dependent 26S proteasome regulatory subunit
LAPVSSHDELRRRFQAVGGIDWHQNVDRGAVLHGPPGFGKTFFGRVLAKAIGAHLLVYVSRKLSLFSAIVSLGRRLA